MGQSQEMGYGEEVSEKPVYSFIVCTRNRAEYAEACVKNLLQSNIERTFEVIVRDNHSEDQTEQTFREMADSRVKYFRADQNQPWSTFLEAGKLAEGKLLTWLSDEDDLMIDNLEGVLSKFEKNPNCNVVIGSVIVGPRKTPVDFPDRAYDPSSAEDAYFLTQQFSGCGGVFVRGEAFKAACTFQFENQLDAYRRQNYYPIGYIAALSLQGEELFTTSKVLVCENRHAPTTDNWSNPALLPEKTRALQPHYYPRSVRDRLASQLTQVWFNELLNPLQKARLSRRHVRAFVGNVYSLARLEILDLLRDNYAEVSVRAFVEEIRGLGLDKPIRLRSWVLRSLLLLPARILIFRFLSTRRWLTRTQEVGSMVSR
jgi:glycosyltransferase involved in cell wall biosynthesis